jgi:hypothetical protein
MLLLCDNIKGRPAAEATSETTKTANDREVMLAKQ